MRPITEPEAGVIPSRQETERLATLRSYYALEAGYERRFDDVTLLASRFCKTPVALVGMVDETRVLFKSALGFAVPELPRADAFFDYAIARGKVFEVRDASRDPRFQQHPWVAGAPHIRFYAGVPIVAPDGHVVGSLSVIDYVPRKLVAEQFEALQLLAAQIMAQLELGVLAPRDALTGRYNRRYLAGALARELSRVVARRSQLGVIALDIDRFRRVNETCGEAAGDAALRELGPLLAGSIRKEDIACRLDSDNFVLVMPDAAVEVVAARAEKLRAAVEAMQLNLSPDLACRITVSVGVSAYPEHGGNPEELVLEARHGLYFAQAGGGNRVVIAPRGFDCREPLTDRRAVRPQVRRGALAGACA